jgi:hypothetical protein
MLVAVALFSAFEVSMADYFLDFHLQLTTHKKGINYSCSASQAIVLIAVRAAAQGLITVGYP